jgi:CDP-diacylglycerol---glycerol-3-phosphate 3-phosphatidyltransferase
VNLPNLITLSRIPFLFVIAVLIYAPVWLGATVGFLLFVLAGVTDWLDGYLARRCHMISDLGKLMDALIDKILMIGLFMSLLVKGVIPSWGIFCVLIILCREFLITGLRMIGARAGAILEAEAIGKYKTVFQIIALGVFLLIDALRCDWAYVFPEMWISTLYAINLFWFCFVTVLTAYSGIRYVVKYRKLLQ